MNLHLTVHINVCPGSSAGTDMNYLLNALVRKQPISFFHHLLQVLVFWVLILFPHSVYFLVHHASQCVDHAGHHHGEEEGHHDPPGHQDQQDDGDCLYCLYLDILQCCGSPSYSPQLHLYCGREVRTSWD